MLPNDYNLALAPVLPPVFPEQEEALGSSDEFDCRMLFHKLIHISENYAALSEAWRLSQSHLQRINRQHSGKFISEYKPDKLIKDGKQQLINPALTVVSGLSFAQLADALVQFAPVFMTEPAWLSAITQTAASQSPLALELTKIYLNLTEGEHNLAGSQMVYRGYLLSLDRQLPDLTALAFTRQEKVCDEAFEQAAMQLALAQFPRVYFAEILGYTLAYCSSPSLAECWLTAATQGESGKFLTARHLRKAQQLSPLKRLIQRYLETFPESHDSLWNRIQTGFWLHRQLCAKLETKIASEISLQKTPRMAAQELILKLLPHALGHHARIKLNGLSLDDWFKEKPFNGNEFFKALLGSAYVDLKHPADSKLLKLFEFGGPMFGVIDTRGKAVLQAWLEDEAAGRKLAMVADEEKEKSAQSVNFLGFPANKAMAGSKAKSVTQSGQLPDFGKLNNRELFYYLVNCELYPGVLAAAKTKVKQLLNQAKWLNPLPFKPYGHQAFEAYINAIYRRETEAFQPLMAQPKLSKAAYLWGIEQFAPSILTDGSWLQGAHQLAFSSNHPIGAFLDKIYHDETGQGILKQNHPYIYRELLDNLGIHLPPVFTREFCEHPGFINSAFDIPVFLMAIAKFPSAFLPEILGLNMAIELSGLGKVYLRLSQELSYWGINPAIVDVHISIDNLATGHSALAVKAIQTYLDEISAVCGYDIMQEHWRRIYTGYCALQTVSNRFKFSLIGHYFFRTCSRSLRTAVSCGRTERKNRSLHGVNEDFEHRPTANGGGAVDFEQVLRRPHAANND